MLDPDELLDGEEEVSLDDGDVVDASLELGEELDPLDALLESPWLELDPLVDESLGLLLELEEPEPFVASSLRQSSFAVPLIESQRGLLPYELVEEPVDEESDELGELELELCANAAMGKASATAITANFTFMRPPWVGNCGP